MKFGQYALKTPELIDTPAMLTYSNLVRHNIEEIIRMCGTDGVVPHVKTHKSVDVLKMQIEMGITSFKCATLREAEMSVEAGADEIIMAYPIIHPLKLERLAQLKDANPEVRINTIVSTRQHLQELSSTMKKYRQYIGVYMDVDTGMRRTGVQPGKDAKDLYSKIADTEFLNPIGLHVFDGETLYIPDRGQRKAIIEGNLRKFQEIWDYAHARGIPVSDNLAGGSWSFSNYVGHPGIRVTPGTWIYWDTRNSEMNELNFKIASLILGQVVDRDNEMNTVTLDIGSKSSSSDQPLEHRFSLIDFPNAELVQQSEEHGVVKLNGHSLEVGDFVLAAPGHACTLTVKFPFTRVIDGSGQIIGKFRHTARDR
jgi:D-serine deaminase-like pyridoxal phosphate-dependent protein